MLVVYLLRKNLMDPAIGGYVRGRIVGFIRLLNKQKHHPF